MLVFFLFIPAFMAFTTALIGIIFKEYFCILPLVIIGSINLILAYLLYRFCLEPKKIHLWDSMISVALGWFFCPLFGALAYIFVAKAALYVAPSDAIVALIKPINALFESFSGFTSSGLTMLDKVSKLPHTLQWLRSFQQWAGGVGLIIFVLSLIEPNIEEYQLYCTETKSKGFNKSILKTTRSIIFIYTQRTSKLGSNFLIFIDSLLRD